MLGRKFWCFMHEGRSTFAAACAFKMPIRSMIECGKLQGLMAQEAACASIRSLNCSLPCKGFDYESDCVMQASLFSPECQKDNDSAIKQSPLAEGKTCCDREDAICGRKVMSN